MKCEKCNGKKEIYQKNPDCKTSCDVENCEGYGGEYCITPSICEACNGTGKQPEAPERIFAYGYDPDYHHYEASSEKKLESDIEYIRKDKAACCGNCDNIRATLQDREFCHITGDFPSERICDKWVLRK